MTLHPTGSTATAREAVTRIARDVARREFSEADDQVEWPVQTMRALADAGLLGLLVPKDAGGLGGGFVDLVTACEALATEFPSAGLAFGMHCVGTACVTARATPEQSRRYLEWIARGEHVTTLALSETGRGVHLYLPRLHVRRDGDDFVLNGEKAFVTNASHASSFVVSTASLAADEDPGRFNLFVVDADAPGVTVGRPWRGMGMRANDARTVHFEDARVPASALLGGEGEETWYVFEVVAPYFISAMTGTYLGITGRAVEETRVALAERTYKDLGAGLADEPVALDKYAHAWTRAASARSLLYDAARLADAGDETAGMMLMAAKAMMDETVVDVTRDALALGGGRAYAKDGVLGRLHRDALASQVMSPTAPMLRAWIARSALGLPLLAEA